jgi:TonB family protein
MSPGALALAVLLHIAAALALWWMTVNRPTPPLVEEAIEVTIEKPKPPEPPPPEPPKPQPPPRPQAQPKPQPAPPLQGMPPPAEITADKRTQVPPSGDQRKDIAGPPPRSLDDPVPEPQPPAAPAAPEPPQPKEPPPPPPPLEQAVPQPPPPAPAVASLPPPPKEVPPLEQAVPTPPPPAPAVASLPPPPKEPPPPPVVPKPPPAPSITTVQPPSRPQTPPAVMPHPQPRPTPQVARPQERPPAIANRDTPPSSSPFVNPADVRNRALVGDNYRWQIVRKLRGYRFSTPGPVGEAHFVVRVDIARDGRLLAVDVVQSSGIAVVDQGALNGIRAGSPYSPLPPEIGGNSASFTLSLMSIPVGPQY